MLDREKFRELCRGARTIDPRFQFGAVLYCLQPEKDSERAREERQKYQSYYRGFLKRTTSIDETRWTRQLEVFADYISDEEISSCISEVAIFNPGTGPQEGVAKSWQYEDLLRSRECVDYARANFGRENKIHQGAYVSGYAVLDQIDRIMNYHYASQTGADAVMLFLGPLDPFEPATTEEAELNSVTRAFLKGRYTMPPHLISDMRP